MASDLSSGAVMDEKQIRSQIVRLLHAHPHIGSDIDPLMSVLESCNFSWKTENTEICREGEMGASLFFLLDGSISVTKSEWGGRERKLLTINAPALLGHMSLVDRSKRSATCVTNSQAYVGELTRQLYDHFFYDPGKPGTAFRRLLLASLNQQLLRGNKQLFELLKVEKVPASREALLETVGVLEGWKRTSPSDLAPFQGDDWWAEVHRLALDLPLEMGARMEIDREARSPFLLLLHGLSSEGAMRVVSRFMRFLHNIPLPPQARIQFTNCPVGHLERPRQVSKQVRLFFPRGTFKVSGDETAVMVRFSDSDNRW